jgi:hypothetical protein
MFARYYRLPGLFLTAVTGSLLLLTGHAGHTAPATPAAPAARHTAPATAAPGRVTNIPVEFDLPAGHTLTGFPRLRVLTAKGRIQELRPVYITQKPPAGRGQRQLNTGRYSPGVYILRVECSFKDAAGKTGMAVSPFSTLTVPAR